MAAKILTQSSGNEHHHPPPDVQHGGVVEDVQECDLVVLLAQNHQNGVVQLNRLREEVPPQNVCYLHAPVTKI